MVDLVDLLNLYNDASEELQRAGATQCMNLSVLNRLLDMTIADVNVSPYDSAEIRQAEEARRASLVSLRNSLGPLQRTAAEEMVGNPLRYVDPPRYQRWLDASDELINALGNELFKGDDQSGLTRAVRGPDFPINGRSLKNRMAEILERAYRALARSPRAGIALSHIDQALAALGRSGTNTSAQSPPQGSQGAPQSPPSDDPALATFLGAFGEAVIGTTATVGNLPGPASLGTACLELSILSVLPRAMRDPVSNPARMLAYRSYLARLGNLSLTEIMQFEEALANGNSVAVRTYAQRISGRFMTDGGWPQFMLFVNAYGLLATIEADDSIYARKVANIIGGSENTALAVMQTIRGLAPHGVLNTILESRAGAMFGVTSGVATVIAGVLTVYEGIVTHNRVLQFVGGTQALGGALSVTGYVAGAVMAEEVATGALVFLVPGLQAAGMVLIVLSASVSIYDQLRQHQDPPPKIVFLAQLQAFHDSTEFRSVSAGPGSSLESNYVPVFNAASSNQSFSRLRRTAENENMLEALRFQPDDVEQLLEPAQAHIPVFTPVGFGI
jgi:hypothetical protein